MKLYKTVILPFVLYGCETWSLALREEHMLRVKGRDPLRRPRIILKLISKK
jgi:hypothetical protein